MPVFAQDSTTIAVASAIALAAIALALAIVVVVLLSRQRKAPNAELERMLQDSTARFEGMLGDMRTELERAQEESRRSRSLSAIGS